MEVQFGSLRHSPYYERRREMRPPEAMLAVVFPEIICEEIPHFLRTIELIFVARLASILTLLSSSSFVVPSTSCINISQLRVETCT